MIECDLRCIIMCVECGISRNDLSTGVADRSTCINCIVSGNRCCSKVQGIRRPKVNIIPRGAECPFEIISCVKQGYIRTAGGRCYGGYSGSIDIQ